MKLRYEVVVSAAQVTVLQLDELRDLLREYGSIADERREGAQVRLWVEVEVEAIYGRGDYGPPAWARDAAGFSEVLGETPAKLTEGVSAALGAVGLATWWDEHTASLRSLTGNESVSWPEEPEVVE